MYSYLKTVHLQQLIYPVLQVLEYKITAINNIGRERGRVRSKKKAFTGCKESQFHSPPLGWAAASICKPKSRFNSPRKVFWWSRLITVLLWIERPKTYHLPIGQVKKSIHQPDSKIHQPPATGHKFLRTLADSVDETFFVWYFR